jgi:hypothetical protein
MVSHGETETYVGLVEASDKAGFVGFDVDPQFRQHVG